MQQQGYFRKTCRAVVLLAAATVLSACDSGGGAASAVTEDQGSWVLHWNQVAIDATGYDHGHAGQQPGPGKSSLAMAIVHLAMFEAANGISPRYESYLDNPPVPAANASMKAAIMQAAHDTLVAMFSAQGAALDAELQESLLVITDVSARNAGIDYGKAVAGAILADRSGDGTEFNVGEAERRWATSDLPGHWRRDPLNAGQPAMGAFWGQVRPLALESASQFRLPPPPAMGSPEYAAAFDEVKRLGGDGVITPTERTAEQTQIGIFWAYDGTPSLCAPPRLYNQIAVQIARQQGTTDVVELARLLALVNVAMADAGIGLWEAKYFYDFWRPVTGIREADAGTGPTGAGDGNALTVGDANFVPLGAPASNLSSPDFTPPFPAYPSGHSGFGGALFQTLRNFYGTDNIAFTFVSDEYNGVTQDNQGLVRPLVPRSFANLSEAEEENAQSRIYLGIHWSFDKDGIVQGNQIADYVFDTILRPLP